MKAWIVYKRLQGMLPRCTIRKNAEGQILIHTGMLGWITWPFELTFFLDKYFPDCQIEKDSIGQLVIYTHARESACGYLVAQ